jgi:hypothetical protein
MRRPHLILALAACAAIFAGGARAAPSPADADTVVEELVVTAATPSPAWWRVSNGESTVWILGAPMGPLPKDLKWDLKVLDKRMDGAKALILPSAATAGIGDIFGLLRLRGKLKEKASLEPSLPEPLRIRFAAARTAMGKDAGRYDGWSPVWAGMLLQRDYLEQAGLRGGASIPGLARDAGRRHHVEVQRATHPAMPVLRSAVDQMRDEQKALNCLGGYLESVETPPERYRRAARAWAVGEVRTAIDLPRGADICRELFTDEFTANSIRDEVAAIDTALQTPGSSVAVVPLRQLLVRSGVLAQLKAKGFEIVDPASLTDD